MDLVIKDDSYARRREVFKNIWVSALRPIDNHPHHYKSKIIRTARLSSELQRYNFTKKKHQKRIKNLKIECDKLLGNDTEAMFFEQLTASHPLRKNKRRKKKKQSSKKNKDNDLRQLKSLTIVRSVCSEEGKFAKLPTQVMAIEAERNVENPPNNTVGDDLPETTIKRRRRRLLKRKRGKRKNHSA